MREAERLFRQFQSGPSRCRMQRLSHAASSRQNTFASNESIFRQFHADGTLSAQRLKSLPRKAILKPYEPAVKKGLAHLLPLGVILIAGRLFYVDVSRAARRWNKRLQRLIIRK